jgi:hypothetical protein
MPILIIGNPAPIFAAEEEVLTHSGVLGMKWGIRRTPAQLGHPTSGDSESKGGGKTTGGPKGTKKVGGGKSSGKSSAPHPGTMNEEHLKKVISRLQMEENYSNLVARKKDRETSPLKKFASEAISNIGKQVLSTAVNKMVSKIFEKKTNTADFDFKDPSKQSPEKLKAAVSWYSMQAAYKKLRAAEDKP